MANCSLCSKNAIYFKRENEKFYCEDHFIEYFLNTIKDSISNLEFQHMKIAVNYSAGKDSSVILHVLKKYFGFDVVALTADIGIEGYFEKISGIGKRFCSDLGVDYYGIRMKDELGKGLQDLFDNNNDNMACHFCGEIRNIVLDRAAKRLGVDAVVTGHNLDDAVRFLLNNYMRNDIFRTTAFSSIIYPPVSQKETIGYTNPYAVKPLLYLTEKEISLYSLIHKLELIKCYCIYGKDEENIMQGWRNKLTNAVQFIESDYPYFGKQLVNNFGKNFVPMFEKVIKSSSDFKIRQCAFCKESMNTTDTDICLFCDNCQKKIGISITDNSNCIPFKIS